MKRLLDLGVTLDKRNRRGDTPLLLAASHGNPDIIYYLLDKGADRNIFDSWYGWTILHHAALKNNASLIHTLIEKYDMDVDCAPPYGARFGVDWYKTPLHEAVKTG